MRCTIFFVAARCPHSDVRGIDVVNKDYICPLMVYYYSFTMEEHPGVLPLHGIYESEAEK